MNNKIELDELGHERYYCTKPHYGQRGMYHYQDEVIYEKHLEKPKEIVNELIQMWNKTIN